jgi:uncharacterized protein (UPF0261 family)
MASDGDGAAAVAALGISGGGGDDWAPPLRRNLPLLAPHEVIFWLATCDVLR